MSRKSGTLTSLGISAAVVAGTFWFIYHNSIGYGFSQWNRPYHMMMGGGGMGIFMILFWVVAIAGIVLALSGITPGKRSLPDALETLKHRYANGEIDKAQYEAMKRDLRQ